MTSVSSDRRQGVNSSAAVKVPCLVATAGNVVLSGEQVIDGSQTANSRVLVWKQTNPVENGIYDSDSGAWTRALDFDGAYDIVQGTIVPINQGTYGGYAFRITTQAPAIGSAIAFAVLGLFTSSSILVLNSIADLKALALPGAALTCIVRGFAAAGDGGGGIYWWNAADNTADNAGTIIQLNAGGAGRFNKLF